jgi:hypothetical protein
MKKNAVEELIQRLESYLECWKQLHNFMTLARQKKFTQDDENQFLEIKSVITQEFELIMSSIDCGAISREDVHALIASGPSVRYLSEMNEGSLRNLENQWHKLFIGLQSLLGQLKVKQQQHESKSLVKSFFGRRTS